MTSSHGSPNKPFQADTGKSVLDWLKEAVNHVPASGQEKTSGGLTVPYARDAVELLAPIPRPPASRVSRLGPRTLTIPGTRSTRC